MKRILIVWFDLTEPGQNRERLIQKIKAHGTWARLGNSAYLIVTDQAPSVVRDGLSALLSSADRVFVGVASSPAAWRGLPEEVAKWIVANQPRG